MDLKAADKLEGRPWKLARLAAILFFALAGGLLISSLAGPDSTRLGLNLQAHSISSLFSSQPMQG